MREYMKEKRREEIESEDEKYEKRIINDDENEKYEKIIEMDIRKLEKKINGNLNKELENKIYKVGKNEENKGWNIDIKVGIIGSCKK
jgi:aconitate hydratase